MAVKGPPLFYTCASKYRKVCCREKAVVTSRRGECGEQEITGSRTGYGEEGNRQDSSLQGQGAQLSMLQLSLVSPGQKFMPVFQLNPHAWCQWPTHGHTERLAEQPQAQCIEITSKPQGKVPEQRQSMQCLYVPLI